MTATPQSLSGRGRVRRISRSLLPRVEVPVLPLAGAAAMFALWQTVAATDLLGSSIPTVNEVLQAIGSRTDILRRATTATTLRALDGGLAGLLIGIGLASLTALIPRTYGSVIRTVVLVNAIPVVALGPILMSLSVRPRIPEIFAALSVTFSTVVAVSSGFQSLSSASTDLFSVLGASKWTRFWRLQVPSATPLIADALRLAVPAAVLGAILGEWFGADRGLGVLMVSAMRNLQYGLLWGAAAIAVIVSMAGYGVGTALERAAADRFGRSSETPRNPGQLGRWAEIGLGIAVPSAMVVLWQAWISAADVPLIVAPAPRGVLEAFASDPGEYLHAALLTTLSAVGGLACGAALGVALAVSVSLAPWLRSLMSPLTLMIPTVPIVVFVPVLGAIFGYATETVLAACVLMAFFPVYVLMLSGLATRPPGSDDLFTAYAAGTMQRLLRLSLPASVPALLLAIRLAAANCFLIAISAEWLMGRGGLGRLFSQKRVFLDTNGSWAAVIVAVLLSLIAYLGAATLEKKVADRWN